MAFIVLKLTKHTVGKRMFIFLKLQSVIKENKCPHLKQKFAHAVFTLIHFIAES